MQNAEGRRLHEASQTRVRDIIREEAVTQKNKRSLLGIFAINAPLMSIDRQLGLAANPQVF